MLAGRVPIVTGFLGVGEESGAITTLGRGGSDLTCTVFANALGCAEAQVWKDVDGVLTADPRLVPNAIAVPKLTYAEATELAYFGAQVLHPQAMRPCIQSTNGLVVRVRSSYNVAAPGTVIGMDRDLSDVLLTSVVKKSPVTLLDISSLRSLGQYGFLTNIFATLARNGISVDVVATSEVSVSVTLDPAKIWSRDVSESELERLIGELRVHASGVKVVPDAAIISMVCNADRSSELLSRAFGSLHKEGINARMLSMGASKTNVAISVDAVRADDAIKAIHEEFFPNAVGTWVDPFAKAKDDDPALTKGAPIVAGQDA